MGANDKAEATYHPRKTVTLNGQSTLDGRDFASALKSFEYALNQLEGQATAQGREVLFDTLSVGIERVESDERSIISKRPIIHTYTTIVVSALAVM